MSTYLGPATLLFSDDEYPVHADLRHDFSGQLPSWGGSITAQPGKPADMWEVAHSGSNQRLRLPDGREGEFMVANFGMGDTLSIKGSGPAPF